VSAVEQKPTSWLELAGLLGGLTAVLCLLDYMLFGDVWGALGMMVALVGASLIK
jgi:hypothetical protein